MARRLGSPRPGYDCGDGQRPLPSRGRDHQMREGLAEGTPVDFELPAGRVAGRRWGAADAPLVMAIPGLSQDERSYAYLGGLLGSDRRQLLAISPRGRGRSETTPSGTYGWRAHARDVAEIASRLGSVEFDLIGWSFGGFVGMQLAAQAPGRLRRLVLLDVAGRPEPSSLGPILAGLERLGRVYSSPEEYVKLVVSSGVVAGCVEPWREYLLGDLVPCPGGYRTRTNREAVLEDAAYGAGQDPYELWPALSMPALLVRAAQPILPDLGFVVSEEDRDRFKAEVPGAQVVEVDCNHYCIGMKGETAAAVERFLDG